MKVAALPSTGIFGLVLLLAVTCFLGCSSKKDSEGENSEKPVVQEMEIEAPADDEVPMH